MTEDKPKKPGWYPDPENRGRVRWWDGQEWGRSADSAPTPLWAWVFVGVIAAFGFVLLSVALSFSLSSDALLPLVFGMPVLFLLLVALILRKRYSRNDVKGGRHYKILIWIPLAVFILIWLSVVIQGLIDSWT